MRCIICDDGRLDCPREENKGDPFAPCGREDPDHFFFWDINEEPWVEYEDEGVPPGSAFDEDEWNPDWGF